MKRRLKKIISSGIFSLDTKIEVWEPCQIFCRKYKTVQNFWKKFQAKNCSSEHAEGSFDNFLKFFGQKSENISLKIGKKSEKKSWKNCFFRGFYSGHVDRILRTIPKVSAEKAKRFKTFKCFFKPKIVRLHTQKLVLTTSWSFLAKSLKNFYSKFERNSEEKNKKNHFFCNFCAGHVDRILRTMPKVSAENPERFKFF